MADSKKIAIKYRVQWICVPRTTYPLFVITVRILIQLVESGPEKDVRYSRGFAMAEFVISVFLSYRIKKGMIRGFQNCSL